MKFAICLLVFGAMFLFRGETLRAQDDKLDKLSFEDSPLLDEKPPYFAVAGGFLGTFLFTNFDELNKAATSFGVGEFKSPVFLTGAQGFTAIGVVPNLRLGVLSVGGKATSQKNIDTATVTNTMPVTKTMEYSTSLTGFTIDYAIQPFKRFAIIPGVMLGFGTVAVERSQTTKTRNFDDPLPKIDNFFHRLDASTTILQPNLNIEYAITQFSMIRVNAGYMMSFLGDWKADRQTVVTGVPDKMNSSGLTLQFGIFVGLFN
jgi:hypothetical protein